MFGDKTFWVIQGLLKYLPFTTARTLRTWLYRPFFRHLGAGVRIEDGVTIKYPSEIELGDQVVIGQQCFLVGLGGLRIGRYTMVGHHTTIITTSHVHAAVDVPMRLQGLVAAATVVGEDVWLGSSVSILGGASVGDHSIVGTGAVVLGRAYPAYAVLGGVPARILKRRDGAPAEPA